MNVRAPISILVALIAFQDGAILASADDPVPGAFERCLRLVADRQDEVARLEPGARPDALSREVAVRLGMCRSHALASRNRQQLALVGVPSSRAPGSSSTATILGRVVGADGLSLQFPLVEAFDGAGLSVATDVGDSVGRFQLELPGGTSYFLRAEAAGPVVPAMYPNVPCPTPCDVLTGVPVALEAGQTRTGVDLLLPRSASIRGRVRAEGEVGPLSLDFQIWDELGAPVAANIQVDATGAFEIFGLMAGTYYLAVQGESATRRYDPVLWGGTTCPWWECGLVCEPTSGMPIETSVGVGAEGIDFDLLPMPAISGTVLIGTEGAAALVQARTTPECFGVHYTYTDGNGNYALPVPSSGSADYFLQATPSADPFALGQVYGGSPCNPSSCLPFGGTPVVAGAVADFDLVRGGKVCASVVVEPPASQGVGVPVRLYSDLGTPSDSISATSPFLSCSTPLAPGIYKAIAGPVQAPWRTYQSQVWPNAPCAPSGCDPAVGDPIQVVAAENSIVSFALPAWATLAGTTYDAVRGGGVGAVTVRAYDELLNLLGTATASSSGQFTLLLSEPPAGDYYLRASASGAFAEALYGVGGCPGCPILQGTPISLTSPGQVAPGLDIGLRRHSGIEGRVTRAGDGAPIEGAIVDAWAPEGYSVGSVATSSDGWYFVPVGWPPQIYASSDNRRGGLDEVFDDVGCPVGPVYLGLCDHLTGAAIAITTGGLSTLGVDFEIDGLGVFDDGFESGGTGAWSAVLP